MNFILNLPFLPCICALLFLIKFILYLNSNQMISVFYLQAFLKRYVININFTKSNTGKEYPACPSI